MASPEQFADDMDEMAEELFPQIRRRMRDYVEDFLYQDVWGLFDGDPLNVRTGALRNDGAITETGSDAKSWRISLGWNSVYAPVQLAGPPGGTTIVPRRAKKLAVPLPAALTPAGVPRGSPRSFPDTFIKTSKAGNLIIFQSQDDGGILPLFVLKDQVNVPARANVFDMWDDDKPRRSKLLKEAAMAAALEGGGKRG